ncbi:fumarylacetoacetate hydrolase family protein [Caldinitratiruptor microaerophilus]|uniref:2-hydroxyhepta-2,4-diene-1,7-dioate isomerase n=1 Tax=Caldinitratiruptor microaerophilus TaxID=671077 RepID=A0AA35CMA1_9FIRM|nr:fumarylacetoacetate hydrolase family protein [Caldinitratiruptor microaerophilus]BDG60177.1 2-hydroxyhepta-2,4-diene-1,7-dioate isomerase [Caldinitratiruptor microaerophilus]
MQICRFHVPGEGAHVGVVRDGRVHDATAAGLIADLAGFLASPDRLRLAERTFAEAPPGPPLSDLFRPPAPDVPHLLPPLDLQEVWAAGVTYTRSREARMRESGSPDIYDRVYDAPRPEIFFKATPHRVVGPGAPITIRPDSDWDVPEPELAVVLSPDLEVVGYTVGNDVSSRRIEGENPLYLPQAKIWVGSCAVGPVITLAGDLDPMQSTMQMRIRRGGETVFEGSIAISQMRRSISELVTYLGRYNRFPHGAVLLTGTALVPPDDFTLLPGDRVEITISGIGTLANPVARAE